MVSRRRSNVERIKRAAIVGDTFDILYEAYGETMALADICRVLQLSLKAGYNRIDRGTFPIELWKNCSSRWMAKTGDVAAHIDELRGKR